MWWLHSCTQRVGSDKEADPSAAAELWPWICAWPHYFFLLKNSGTNQVKQWMCYSLGAFGVYLPCRPWRRDTFREMIGSHAFCQLTPSSRVQLIVHIAQGDIYSMISKVLIDLVPDCISSLIFAAPFPMIPIVATPHCGTLRIAGCFKPPLFYIFSLSDLSALSFSFCLLLCLPNTFLIIFKSQWSLPILGEAFLSLPTLFWHHR